MFSGVFPIRVRLANPDPRSYDYTLRADPRLYRTAQSESPEEVECRENFMEESQEYLPVADRVYRIAHT